MIRLDPGERHVKRRDNTRVYCREKRITKCIQTSEQHGSNAVGSLGEPMGKRAVVQGQPLALVHAYAANTHHTSHRFVLNKFLVMKAVN